MTKQSLYGAALAPNVITLSLRYPSQDTPIQRWTFTNESVVKIGRCADNHIVLHSSVVSRHHVELRRITTQWKVINFGHNGTYLDGQPITEAIATDGMVIRLALSGPQLQINLDSTPPDPILKNALLQKPENPKKNRQLRETFLTFLQSLCLPRVGAVG